MTDKTGNLPFSVRFATALPDGIGDRIRYDEARQHYQEATRVCTDLSFRPELALTRPRGERS